MKKISFLQAAVLSAGLLSCASSFSQLADSDRLASIRLVNTSSSAAAVNPLSEADKAALADMKKSNSSMFNHFIADFPDAVNIKVHPAKNETLISCMINGDVSKLHYSNKGKLMSSVRYFDAQRLPDALKDLVLDAYPRYAVFGFVAEVHAAGKIAHFVMIRNGHSWKRVRIVDNSVDTSEEYQDL